MSRSVNSVHLVGNLGRDAESKQVGDATVTRFSVATTERWKDKQSGEWKDKTEWTNVTLWRGEGVVPFLTKGKQVYVQGKLQTRQYEKDGQKHYATEVVANEVILLGGNAGGESHDERTPATRTNNAPLGDTIPDDSVPF